jgi:hypothetical protein
MSLAGRLLNMAKRASEARGNATKPVGAPMSFEDAMAALLAVKPEELDDALKQEAEHRDQSNGHT